MYKYISTAFPFVIRYLLQCSSLGTVIGELLSTHGYCFDLTHCVFGHRQLKPFDNTIDIGYNSYYLGMCVA